MSENETYAPGPDPLDGDLRDLHDQARTHRDAVATALQNAYLAGFAAGRRAEYVETRQGRGLDWEAARGLAPSTPSGKDEN